VIGKLRSQERFFVITHQAQAKKDVNWSVISYDKYATKKKYAGAIQCSGDVGGRALLRLKTVSLRSGPKTVVKCTSAFWCFGTDR